MVLSLQVAENRYYSEVTKIFFRPMNSIRWVTVDMAQVIDIKDKFVFAVQTESEKKRCPES